MSRGQEFQALPLVKEALLDCQVDLEDTYLARPFRPTLRDSRAEIFDRPPRWLTPRRSPVV
jgi:hypothetical protein